MLVRNTILWMNSLWDQGYNGYIRLYLYAIPIVLYIIKKK